MVSMYMVRVNMLLTGLVLLGSINWGLASFGFNLVEIVSSFINKLLKTQLPINRILYLVVAGAGILLAMRKTTWLPFLGYNVLPESLVPLTVPSETDRKILVNVKPNTKVAYWAALPYDEVPQVKVAYGKFTNAGVVMSDANGIAELPILTGSSYTVPSGREIPRHIHYRELGLQYGMVGPIKTVKY